MSSPRPAKSPKPKKTAVKASKRRSAKQSIKQPAAEVYSPRISKRWVITMLLLFFLFWAYSTSQYGSIMGFVHEHTSFPGGESSRPVQGRKAALAKFTDLEAKLAAAKLAPTISGYALQYYDNCHKGIHQPFQPFFGPARNDPYAYQCTLLIKKLYAFNNSACQLATTLIQSHIKFSIDQNCEGKIWQLSEWGGFSSYNPDIVGAPAVPTDFEDVWIYSLDDYLANPNYYLTGAADAFDGTSCEQSRLYCRDKSPRIADINETVAGLRTRSQAVINVTLRDNYFSN